MKSFLVGVSVGTLLAIVIKPRNSLGPLGQADGILETTSEDFFPASDMPTPSRMLKKILGVARVKTAYQLDALQGLPEGLGYIWLPRIWMLCSSRIIFQRPSSTTGSQKNILI